MMKKKILFMNSAKLTAISLGVLLAVFCIIGMSFTPGEEGDNVGNPNDSTYVTGPRRSHWTETGCSTTYKNKKDYGKVVITVVGTGGTISASGNNSTSSTSNNNSTSVTVTWNCGYDGDGQHSDLVAKHTNRITYTAHPASGYQLEGWYTDAECTALVSSNPEDFVIGHSSYEGSQNGEYEGSTKAQTWNRYAKFVRDEPVDLTFIAPGVGGSYTVTISGSLSTVSSANVVKTGITTEVALVATPASGYIFAGWYQIDEGKVGDLSTDVSYNKKFAKSVSVGARFISTSTPKFKNITKNVEYYGLRQATLAASAGDKIIPVADCVVDGSDLVTGESYTIPAGVTLLVPFDNANTSYTTAPATTKPAADSPSPYRTLTLAEGVKINVEGDISVPAKQYGTNTSAGQHGVRGKYGFIYMDAGSEIVLKSGANLYAWGYISGDGEITAKSGSNIYEMFQFTDFRGGSATSNIAGNTKKVFPFSQYYIQNIESTLHIEYGATEKVYAVIYVSSSNYPATATLIGSTEALFTMSSGCILTKKYDRLTDRMHFSLNGNATLSALSLRFTGIPLMGTIDLSTSDYTLPLNSNMTINVMENKTITVAQDLAILPGAEVHIASGAKMVLNSGKKIYVYDEDEWKTKTFVFSGLDVKPLAYVARNHLGVAGAPRTRTIDADAKFVVDGGIEATGAFYTTTSGANICSSGTGYFKFVTNNAPTNTNTYQLHQDGSGNITYNEVPITSAQLHNDDGKYTTTSGAPANTTINYKHGHWGWCVIWKLEDGTELKRAYYYKQPDATWISNNKPAETHPDAGTSSCTYTFNGWTQNTISAQQEIEVTASFTKTCPNYYEVTWKSEDGNTTLETDASVGEGEATRFNGTVPAKATDWGVYQMYEFDGWTTEANGAGTFYADGSTPAATADATYYAHYAVTYMVAKVTFAGGGEPTYFTDVVKAFAKAVENDNATITILNDASGISTTLTYNRPSTTCTLNLNGHTVSGACASLLTINASGSTFTITDTTTAKNGRLENIFAQNAVTYGITLTAGTLNVEHGTIHAENPAQYASAANTSLGVTKLDACGARGIHMAATNTLNISDGRVEAKATRNAFAVYEASSAANNTTVNITGGELYAEAPYAAYGVYAYGKLNVSGNNTITVKINTDMVNAYYAADNANNKKNGDGRGIFMQISANKAQTSCYYGTLTYTGGTINVTNERSNKDNTERTYGILFNCDNASTDNRGGAIDGSSGQKAAAKGSVKNATINITSGCQYAIGIYVCGSYNAYDKSTHVVKIENCNIDVKGYANNYGIWAHAGVNGTNGSCWHSDVQADNCTVRVESTGSSTAYGAFATSIATTIYQYKDPTTEAAGNVASKYYGEYASAAKLTINGGSYTVKTNSTGAYAVGTTVPRSISTYGSKYSAEAYRTIGGHAKDSATLIINGGTFNATSTTYTARGVSSGGNTTVNNATFNVVAGSYQAYGLYAPSGKITATNVVVNDTAKSRVSSSDSNGYAYGAYADCGIPSGNTAQTGFGYAGEIELNNCTLNVATTTYPTARGLVANATSKLHTWTQFKADSASNKWAGTAEKPSQTYNAYKSVFLCTIQGKDSVWIGKAGKITTNGGTINVKAATSSAMGGYVSRSLHYSYHTPNTILEQCPGVLNINGTSFDVSTGTGATAEGVRTYGTVNISGNTYFNIHPATTTAIGLRVYAGTTTVNDNPTFNIKAGTNTAYGAMLGDTPADKTGTLYNCELIINGGTYNVEATTTTAYGVYVQAKARQITSTDAGYYPGTYASIGHATINDGTFNVTAKSYGAFGVYVGKDVTADNLQIFRGVADINGGNFKVRTKVNNSKSNNCDGVLTYGTTTISGGTFDVEATDTVTASKGIYAYGVYVLDGTTTINKNVDDATKPLFNVKAYSTVYSVWVSADVANATTGLTYNGNVIINGGTYNDTTTTGNSAYGVCVSMPAPRVIASGDYAGTYYSTATATINDGTFNVYSAGTTAGGVFTGRNYISANTKPNTFSNWTYGNATINGGTFNTSATTTSVGVYTDGETIVNGGDFNPTGRTSDAYGIYARAGRTTVNNTHNPSFTVKAPTIVYGALVGGTTPDSKTGLSYDGELIVNGGDFDVQTTSGATAYGVFVNANKRKITSTSSGYYQGQYVSAGHATINDGTFYVKAVGKTASGINMVAATSYAADSAPYEAVSATPTCTVTGGKFKVFASSAASAVVSTPLAENMPISGGYYNINTNLAKYAVSPKKVLTLRESHSLYPEDYRYTVNEGGTVTWKNGDETLKTEMYESGETPAYTGETPTKAEDAEYTYTHNGWDPTVEAMANVDKTYTATYSSTPRSYTLTWETDGDALTGTYTNGLVPYGTTIVAPNTPTKTGFTFAGWSDGSSVVTPATTMPAANTTYTATWTVDESGFWLDIVDVDNSAKTLTINTNSWASAGWSYTINDVVYAKNARKADRTLIIPYTGEVGATSSITVKDKLNAVVSKHSYIIPAEIKADANLGDQQMLYVKAGYTLTVNTNKTVKNIYVDPDAKLVVNSGVTLKADTVFLRTKPFASAELELDGTIEGQVCYTRIISKKDQYYQFGLPMPCPIAAVRLSDGSTPTYGGGWLLRSYSEQHRAQNGSGADIDNWVTLTNEGADVNKTIQGGVGYEMFSNSGYYREYYFPVAHTGLSDRVAVTHTTGEAGESHSGWNIVVSPLMRAYTQSPAPEGMTVSWLQQDGSYWQLPVEEIKPAIPFSYQASQTGYIVFDKSISLPAPRRRVPAADEYEQIQWLQLDVEGIDGKADQTSIYSHPTRYERTYKMGIDVAKQSLTASRAILYSSHVYGDMAFAGVADSLLEAGVALTVYSPSAQELTISMRENDWLNRMAEVWLIDHETGARMNLLDGNYTFDAAAGTTSGRFTIQGVFYAPQVTTDIQNGQGEDGQDSKARKVIIEDKMYILLNGQMYDATGKKVNK